MILIVIEFDRDLIKGQSYLSWKPSVFTFLFLIFFILTKITFNRQKPNNLNYNTIKKSY